jgi:dTMP kinase
MPKGLFIAIDGTDGSGKTVQAARLSERLRQMGHPIETLSFPRYGNPAAHFVEKYLHGEYGGAKEVGPYRASMFYALDRYDDSARVRQLLEGGTMIVTNRYVSASKGHQMGKIRDIEERQKFLDWLNDLEYGLHGIPKPDVTILLHVPAEIGKKLADQRDGAMSAKDIHQADLDHLKEAEEAYLILPKIDAMENWIVIECTENDTLLPIEDIHERIWQVVEPLLVQRIS